VRDERADRSASQALAKKFGDPASAKFVWRTEIAIPIEGDHAETLMKLLTQLDDLDDVQDVYSNEDISDEELGAAERLTREKLARHIRTRPTPAESEIRSARPRTSTSAARHNHFERARLRPTT
jgi:hypothetical protein